MKQIKYFFLLAMAMMSLTSYAEDEVEVTWNATWNGTLKGCTIAPDDNTLESYVIPTEVKNPNGSNMWKVIGLKADAFKGNTALKSITFEAPENIVSIGSYAFGSTGLETIDLSVLTNENLKMEASVFEGCTSLTSATLPGSLTKVPQYTFKGCTALEDVDLSSMNITSSGMNVFDGCTNLVSVKLPSTVTKIEQSFVDGCSKFTTLNFNDLSLTEIGSYAFRKTALENVDLSAQTNLTTIGGNAFRGCAELASVTLPESVTSVGAYSFAECPKLADVNFDELTALTTIGNYAFSGAGFTEVDLSKTQITKLGNFAFEKNKSLETVKLPATFTSFGTTPFNSCSNLKTIDFTELTSVPTDKNYGYSPKEFLLSGLDQYNAFMADANWGTNSLEKMYVFPIKVKITDAQYATFCSPRDLDFTGSDVKAYIATGFNAKKSTVKITTVTSVPKGVGILLNCETAGEYEIEQKAASGEFANFFEGTLENKTLPQVDGDNTNLVLSKKNGVVGFYKAKEGMTLGINKAYLPIPTDVLESFGETECVTFSFEGETDGINTISTNAADGAYYTLQGVKVNAPTQKGVYIHNGKKIMVK